MALATTFEQNLLTGQVGESLIARWLRGRGWAVLPVYDIEIHTGKGPRLFMPDHLLIAPDMIAFRSQVTRWIEAKHKTAFSWHRISQRWVTGIDLRHYEDYLRVANESPFPVWLLFLHQGGQAKDSPPNSPAGLFGNDLHVLRNCESHRSNKWGSSGMVYWAESSLLRLASIEEVRGF